MAHKKNITLFFILFSSLFLSAQCGLSETIVICDMESIDYDGDGNPDGFINLYDEYFNTTGINLDTGTWFVDNDLSIPLNSSTGDVLIWDYKSSSNSSDPSSPSPVPEPNYVFELFNASCGSDVAATITLEIGPFSGVALEPVGTTDINFEVCEGNIDLFETLVSNDVIPPPHTNGYWELVGNIPSNTDAYQLNSTTGELYTEVTYQIGSPLVDRALFEFKYVVPGSDNCTQEETNVKISVVRQVESGEPTSLAICESSILSGAYDQDIDLAVLLLQGEDEEGEWTASSNAASEISNSFDSVINIRNLYDNLIINEGTDFGSATFWFRYSVSKRSGVCEDMSSTINITIEEYIKPFSQNNSPVSLCLSETDPSTTINLLDYLEFTTENGVDFTYTNGFWSIASIPNQTSGNDFDITNDGILNIFQDGAYISPGTYVFEYLVTTDICADFSANVTVEILPFDNAGENTNSVMLCEADGSVVLTDLLNADQLRGDVATTGVWVNNADGSIVDNNYDFPQIDQDTDFEFTYTTTHASSGCVDESILSFTIVDEVPAGNAGTPITSDSVIKVCSDNLSLVLFDQLENADTTGIWSGPGSYVSQDHLGTFDSSDSTLPVLIEGDYVYTIEDTEFCVTEQSTTITVQFVDPIVFGGVIERTFCKIDDDDNFGSLDLATLLSVDVPTTGMYNEVNSSGALAGSVVNFETLTTETYVFEYVLDNEPCGTPVQQFEISIIDDSNPPMAGTGPAEPIKICEDNKTITLFDYLEDSPSELGQWTGPFAYVSPDHLGQFVDNDQSLAILGEGEYVYTVGGGFCNTPIFTSTVTIEFVTPVVFNQVIESTFCKIEDDGSFGTLDLSLLLDAGVPTIGAYNELDSVGALSGSIVNFETLTTGTYTFEFILDNEPCGSPVQQFEISIIDDSNPPMAGTSPAEAIEICSDNRTVNLFDYLEGNPSDLGQWTGPFGYVSSSYLGQFVENDPTLPTLNAGEYTYTVGGGVCNTPIFTSTVTVEFIDPIIFDEIITGTFCKINDDDSVGSVDLSTLLVANTPTTGMYIDVDNSGALSGSIVNFETLTTGTYNFEYILDNAPCNTAAQQFEISIIDDSNPPTAGTEPTESVKVCDDNKTINLFDYLEDDPSTLGQWTGPFGYVSTNHLGQFIDGDQNIPVLYEGDYVYTVGGGECNTPIFTSTVTIEFVDPVIFDTAIEETFCKIDESVNLFSLLNENTAKDGAFTAIDTDQSVIDAEGNLSFETLTSDVYNFRYSVSNTAQCDLSSINIEITIVAVEEPELENAEFCILNGALVNDIEFVNADISEINFYHSLTAQQPLSNDQKLVDADVFYVTKVGDNNCESERVQIEVSILNIGEGSSCPLEFQDGVSANGDTINDTFSLNWKDSSYDIVTAFPTYELEIYNRYGVVVFKGNANTEEFDGHNNVSLSVGKELPSGTYFYIFKPNVLNNLPIQGSFYLSK